MHSSARSHQHQRTMAAVALAVPAHCACLLSARCPHVQCAVLSAQCSVLSAQCSVQGARCPHVQCARHGSQHPCTQAPVCQVQGATLPQQPLHLEHLQAQPPARSGQHQAQTFSSEHAQLDLNEPSHP